MSEEKQGSTKAERSADRKERLEQALRENLRKRKRQARVRKRRGGDGEPNAGKA